VSVIDALNESGDPETRQGLLSVLGNEAAERPSNIRVLITPHAEKDIQDGLPAKKHVLSRSLKDIDPNPADATTRFVEAQLRHIAALKCKWPDNCCCRLSLEKSEGHLQWASTTCRFVKEDGRYGQDPVKQLEQLLVKNLCGVDQLYFGILKQIFGDGNEFTDGVKRRFHLVFGCMLAGNRSQYLPCRSCVMKPSGVPKFKIKLDPWALCGAFLLRNLTQSLCCIRLFVTS
jgi:hypothetical protein